MPRCRHQPYKLERILTKPRDQVTSAGFSAKQGMDGTSGESSRVNRVCTSYHAYREERERRDEG